MIYVVFADGEPIQNFDFDLVTSVTVCYHIGPKKIKCLKGDQRWETWEPINDGEKNERQVFCQPR